MSFWLASCTTGTTSPLGVSAANPMWMYFFKIRLVPLGSSDELNSGNGCSALTQARMMKARGVSLMPASWAVCFMRPRSASSSVMSASSNCVTCGMFTQLACRRGPEIFCMRDSALVSTGPNCAKSTTGTAGSAPPPGAGAGAGAPPDSAFFTNAFTSSCVMRPLNPVPLTLVRSTPSSRASSRTDGPAWARENPASLMSGKSGRICPAPSVAAPAGAAEAVPAAGPAAAGLAAPEPGVADAGLPGAESTVADAGLPGAESTVADADPADGDPPDADPAAAGCAESPAPASERSVTTRSPVETLPPLATCTFSTTPLAVDGTSMVAFSVSSVTRGASGSIVSPGLTRTSMTATSLKLPMSGTRTSTSRDAAFIGLALLHFPGYGLGRIDTERLDGFHHRRTVDFAIVC